VKNKLKSLLNPKVLVPTLLSAALLGFLLGFANSGQVFGAILKAISSPEAWISAFFLVILYLLAKLAQWWIYLTRLGVRPGWQEMLVPYAGGEIGNALPMGVYIENYLLKGSGGAGIGRSAAATTWMLITEIIICLLTLLAIGIPGWVWVRPVAAAMIVGTVLIGLFFFKTHYVYDWLNHWKPGWKWLKPVRDGTKQFLEGSSKLFSWHTFVYGLPITAIYLGAHATILYFAGHALTGPNNQHWSWLAAASAFAFSMVIVLLVPVLPHLGSVEASGLGVLIQFGVEHNLALGALLAARLLTTGTIILVCSIMLLALHREVGATIRHLSHDQGDENEQQGQASASEPERQGQGTGVQG
jgi:uncharacterized membrane protein YbhN (UPF0104 family)